MEGVRNKMVVGLVRKEEDRWEEDLVRKFTLESERVTLVDEEDDDGNDEEAEYTSFEEAAVVAAAKIAIRRIREGERTREKKGLGV